MQLNFNPHTFSPQPPPATNPRPIPVTRTSPYVDTGCRYNPSCLDCPLPACVEDLTPQQVKVMLNAVRWARLPGRMDELCRRHGSYEAATILADEEGCSLRTIFRRIAVAKPFPTPPCPPPDSGAGQGGFLLFGKHSAAAHLQLAFIPKPTAGACE